MSIHQRDAAISDLVKQIRGRISLAKRDYLFEQLVELWVKSENNMTATVITNRYKNILTCLTEQFPPPARRYAEELMSAGLSANQVARLFPDSRIINGLPKEFAAISDLNRISISNAARDVVLDFNRGQPYLADAMDSVIPAELWHKPGGAWVGRFVDINLHPLKLGYRFKDEKGIEDIVASVMPAAADTDLPAKRGLKR